MINHYNLNYELGVMLYRFSNKDELSTYCSLLDSLGFSRVILEKIKEGYTDIYNKSGKDSGELEKQFSHKLQTLNLPFIKLAPTTTTGESLFDYVGKQVYIESLIKDERRPKLGKETILDIKLNPETGDYEIIFKRDFERNFDFGWGLYLSDIAITPIKE